LSLADIFQADMRDKQVNTLGAVSRGTTIDHIQCSFINIDAFENEVLSILINLSHLVAYRCVDDNWDTDNLDIVESATVCLL